MIAKVQAVKVECLKALIIVDEASVDLRGAYGEGAQEILTVCEVVAWLHRSHQRVANQRRTAMKSTRRHHGASFNVQVASAAGKGD